MIYRKKKYLKKYSSVSMIMHFKNKTWNAIFAKHEIWKGNSSTQEWWAAFIWHLLHKEQNAKL